MTTKLVQALKTLADDTRLDLVKLLLTHDLCVGALAKRLAITEAAVSQHLKQLREASLVRGEKRGYWTHYSVDRERLKDLAGSLGQLAALPQAPDIVCIKQLDHKANHFRQDVKMCNCQCQHPEKVKGKPVDCIPERIKECRGDPKGHPCDEGGKAERQP